MSDHPENAPSLAREIELSDLDLRYQGHRLPQPRLEERLLSVVAERGIEQPLQGVHSGARAILLDGFKRYRCARKLRIETAPFVSWGNDEVSGITRLLRGSPQQGLHLLEQARFVDELKSQHGMSLAEIAQQLSRSKAWVSLRLGLIGQLSPTARDALFTGAFPVYSYLYSLRRFRRVNSQADIDQFIGALRGKKLSVREIEGLAHGFFRGPESFRQEILQGNLTLALEQIQQAPADPDSCSEFERVFLHDLELTQKAMGRVMTKSLDPRLRSSAYLAQCNLLAALLLGQTTAFVKTLRHLHDHTAKT
jgi:KorB domain